MSIIDKSKALSSLYPTEEWVLDGDDLKWLDENTPKPTQAEIDAEIIRLQAEWAASEYARNRQAEYPSLLELTVALYDTDDKSAVEAKRASVKLKYPKPE
tara:strand:- start:134 stop:433 length:300 start_codon:yes stop_codon:yes gene_type:complete